MTLCHYNLREKVAYLQNLPAGRIWSLCVPIGTQKKKRKTKYAPEVEKNKNRR